MMKKGFWGKGRWLIKERGDSILSLVFFLSGIGKLK